MSLVESVSVSLSFSSELRSLHLYKTRRKSLSFVIRPLPYIIFVTYTTCTYTTVTTLYNLVTSIRFNFFLYLPCLSLFCKSLEEAREYSYYTLNPKGVTKCILLKRSSIIRRTFCALCTRKGKTRDILAHWLEGEREKRTSVESITKRMGGS